MKESYPELNANRARIFEDLEKEEEKFSTALEHGTKVLERMLQGLKEAKTLDAKSAFDLFQSYGFPLEITAEMCGERGFLVDEEGFEALMKAHQEMSRKGAEQKFKGGLADHSEGPPSSTPQLTCLTRPCGR